MRSAVGNWVANPAISLCGAAFSEPGLPLLGGPAAQKRSQEVAASRRLLPPHPDEYVLPLHTTPADRRPRVIVFPAGSTRNADMNETDRTCGRIDVDETLPSIEVPRLILNELYSHALDALPEECCGLIVGTDQNRFSRFVRCRNEMTKQHREDGATYPRDGRHAFLMNGLDYMRAIDEAEERGEIVTAVYHSHVDVGAYLSTMDREYAESELFPFPGADQVVISVVDSKVDSVAFFRRDEQACEFFGHTIVPTP